MPEECQEDQASKGYRESAVSEECQGNREPESLPRKTRNRRVQHIVEALDEFILTGTDVITVQNIGDRTQAQGI